MFIRELGTELPDSSPNNSSSSSSSSMLLFRLSLSILSCSLSVMLLSDDLALIFVPSNAILCNLIKSASRAISMDFMNAWLIKSPWCCLNLANVLNQVFAFLQGTCTRYLCLLALPALCWIILHQMRPLM